MIPPAVLLVDDDLNVQAAICRVLRPLGLGLLTAASGEEALEVLTGQEVAVLICDYRLPGMSGVEVLRRSVKVRPDAIRISLTGFAELSVVQAVVNIGRVSHVLLKPWDDEYLRSLVRDSVRQYEMGREVAALHETVKRQRDRLAALNQDLEQKVRERTSELRNAYDETLDTLVLALDSREHATAGHSRRVAAQCLFLALNLEWPSFELEDLYRGALLHDIGKIGVPDAVLLKPGPLNAQERKIMEDHVALGARLLAGISYLRSAEAIPRCHHEWYDGTGYTEGLAAEWIPIQARAFAVVDTYDALTSQRPYKHGIPHAEACGIIEAETGTHFDPEIVAMFLSIPEYVWKEVARVAERKTRFRDILAAFRELRTTTLRIARPAEPSIVEANDR
jgi:response regulator RpfG family c-di-GMP phosphodiesterase